MSLVVGSRLGPYEIVAPLGAGGMGNVYRARDGKLLWRSEFRNVLAGCLRRADLKLETALQIADGAEDQLHGREFSVPSAQVLARAQESDCSAYDCEFVVLAEELGVSLVTSDEKVLRYFPGLARPLGK